MKSLVFVIALAAVSTVTAGLSYQEEIIARVKNTEGLLWEPGFNYHPETNQEFFESLFGNDSTSNGLAMYSSKDSCKSYCENYKHDDDDEEIPDNFDARIKWTNCPSIGKVHDQGECKADYALSVTTVIEDRICIATKGAVKTTISAQQVVSCCKDCGRGCKGGFQQEAWKYLQRRGIASGGTYNSNEGCQPYLKKPIGFSPNSIFSGTKKITTPKCQKTCYNPNYTKTKVRDDLHKGSTPHGMCCCSVKPTLIKDGPVTATMLLFEDFLTYKSGIYHHVTGKRLGHISVKVIGYGTENKQQYWLAINSWSQNWGDKGVFKILKDKSGCEFEDYLFVGEPKI